MSGQDPKAKLAQLICTDATVYVYNRKGDLISSTGTYDVACANNVLRGLQAGSK